MLVFLVKQNYDEGFKVEANLIFRGNMLFGEQFL